MRILIVENEKPASERLCRLVKKIDNSIEILAITETVEATVNWLQENPSLDLILLDIQLDDGLCFEIFDTIKVNTPTIFTTAYDEYTLRAFKHNSIDYLLKPIKEDELRNAFEKFQHLYLNRNYPSIDFTNIFKEYLNQFKSRFLVKVGTKYRSIVINEVKCFHICEKYTFLRDEKGKDFGIDYSLEHLQRILNPEIFFRINRNCIVNINFIVELLSYSSSRLQLVMQNEGKDELFVVSREKVSEFKKWVDR